MDSLLSVDLHCHVLPGVDDGPKTMAETEALARRLLENGIQEVVASSHINSDHYPNSRSNLLEALATTQAHLTAVGLPLRLWPGAEVRLGDEGMAPERWCTVGDRGHYVLVELPLGLPLVESVEASLGDLLARGVTPIVAHPERSALLQRDPQILCQWVERGILAQGTLCVLAGSASERTIRTLETMVALGCIHVMATDAHGADRRVANLATACARLVALAGPANATLMLHLNPGAILAGYRARRPAPVGVADEARLLRRYSACLSAAEAAV